MLPQLIMFRKMGYNHLTVAYYLLAMFLYRCMYIFNWIYRYYDEGFYDLIAIVAGVVQCMTYFLLVFKYNKHSENPDELLVAPIENENTSLIYKYLYLTKNEENTKIWEIGSKSLYNKYKNRSVLFNSLGEYNLNEKNIFYAI